MKREETETVIFETKDRREYDIILLNKFRRYLWVELSIDLSLHFFEDFLNNRYPDKELEDLLKQREELDKRINELKSL